MANAGEHAGETLVAHRPVLRVHQQPVVAAVRELLGDGWTVRVQKQSQFRSTRTQLLLEFGAGQRCIHRQILLMSAVTGVNGRTGSIS